MRRSMALLGLLLLTPTPASAWGFVAHRIVTQNAAAAVPAEMRAFFTTAAPALSAASIEPDSLLKDREGERERRRHYIDLDELSRPPFADLPLEQGRARALYGSERLDRAGLLPWRITEVYGDLTAAFVAGDWRRVVRLAGWLSHYVADAYQPLHTTKNHDGRDSGNAGIHAAFETDMVDRRKPAYAQVTAAPASFSPRRIAEPGRFMLDEIIGSFGHVGEVLKADSEAMLAVKRQRKDYYDELEARAGPLARRQLSRAVETVASLWYSAWVEAGSPHPPDKPPPAPPRGGARKRGQVREGRP